MIVFEINLENLHFFSYHGVMPEERKAGNEFKVWLTVRMPNNPKIEKDDLNGTVSYAILYEIVKEEMEIPSDLLEHVGLRIVNRIQKQFRDLSSGFVKIEKVRPPIAGMLGSASVTVNF